MPDIDRHWTVLIWPEQYDDDDDMGFAWSGPATSEEDAVRQACRECESTNGWEEGDIDETTVKYSDCGPDLEHAARQLWAWAKKTDDAMNAAEHAPTGDDYNALFDLVKAWLAPEGYGEKGARILERLEAAHA